MIIGILYGIRKGHIETKNKIIINHNKYNINFYDYLVEYVYTILKYSLKFVLPSICIGIGTFVIIIIIITNKIINFIKKYCKLYIYKDI